MKRTNMLAAISLSLSLAACGSNVEIAEDYPNRSPLDEKSDEGRAFGDSFIDIFGSRSKTDTPSEPASAAKTISAHPILWQATLDSFSFLPMQEISGAGLGLLISDWFIDPAYPNERFKVEVRFLSSELRADALRISAYRQVKQKGDWISAPLGGGTVRQLEDSVLVRARELYQKQQNIITE